MRLAVCLFALLYTIPAAIWAHTAGFPPKPVRCIVPFAPGGGADGIARLIQSPVSNNLGQSLILDNRSGASGVIGSEIVARAVPDGHTILLITTTHAVNVTLIRTLPYDSIRDFAPVSLLVSQPNILVVRSGAAAQSVQDLVVSARQKPKAISFASGGNGSSPHLSGELFALAAGVMLTHVPYKSAGPGIVDVLGGHVDMIFAGPLDVIPQIKSGRLRPLAVAGPQRSTALPDVPTMAEAGYAGVETGTWYGILAPAGTPPRVVKTLNSAFSQAVRSAETGTRLGALGVNVVDRGPDDFRSFMHTEIDKWRRVVTDAKIPVN